MQLLSKPISDILLGDTDITDITGTGNIWHAKIPQQTTSGSTEPQSISIYFYTYAVTPNDTKSGRSDLDTHMVRVHITGTDDHQMNQVARYVRLALDRIDPGEYSGIPIQGSKFLNSYYEPEGNYQLELQEWRLEFQFRVIDPDARVPGGLSPSWSSPSWYYSETEQTWPYSKWLNGETIYWKTISLTSASSYESFDPKPSGGTQYDGYEILSIVPEEIVDVRMLNQNDTTGYAINPSNKWTLPVLTDFEFYETTTGKIFMRKDDLLFEGQTMNVTIWYTKS
jgi:hypothetical protein